MPNTLSVHVCTCFVKDFFHCCYCYSVTWTGVSGVDFTVLNWKVQGYTDVLLRSFYQSISVVPIQQFSARRCSRYMELETQFVLSNVCWSVDKSDKENSAACLWAGFPICQLVAIPLFPLPFNVENKVFVDRWSCMNIDKGISVIFFVLV